LLEPRCRRRHGIRHKRSYLPPLQKPVRRGELQRGKAPSGTGERMLASKRSSPNNPGPRPPQRDEPKKLLRPPRKRQAVSYIPANIGLSPSAGRAGSSLSPGRLSVTRAASRKETYRCWSGWSISQENPRYGYRSVWAFLRGRPLRLTRSGCTSCEEKKD
jgi:hypothetical protein